jgi:demethylmenaquinone methyltransferase/2-methoxy-6-polyprenyl-1,4-benzoquinol methylase
MTGLRAGAGTLEAGQVRAMFDRIAGVYDLMNTAMTAGLHHRWRSRAAELARVGPGSRALDVATGTGDLAFELAGRVVPGGEVLGSDFSEAMLERARTKAAGRGEGAGAELRFEWADAMSLPYADDCFDAATVGFGARNFEDLGRGLAEMVRVVRPGGRVVVLEITTPSRPPLSRFYAFWFDRLVPALGVGLGAVERLAATVGVGRGGDASGGAGGIAAAYSYLPNSVKRFPNPRALAGELERAGLQEIEYVLTAGGIVAIHAGTVGGEEAR